MQYETKQAKIEAINSGVWGLLGAGDEQFIQMTEDEILECIETVCPEEWAAESEDDQAEWLEAARDLQKKLEGELPVVFVASMDGGASMEFPSADNMDEAEEMAREWAIDGDWPEGEGRFYVNVHLEALRGLEAERIDSRDFDVAVGSDPEPPECTHPDEHDWQAPHEVVGGCTENPGVWQTQGTQVKITAVCSRCGAYRHYTSESTPGNYPETPARTTYEEADEKSLAWVAKLHAIDVEGIIEQIEPVIRKAIRKGYADVEIEVEDITEQIEYSVTKTREDGESMIEIDAGFDYWSESGERQSDFVDDLVEEAIQGTIAHIRELVAERYAIPEE